ncbi:hypothetical protein [Pinirhizobacter soli]|uniref:hypothetical protein n=1 Tax=Pinirhizobacter soli TaxID=2786953 RepID=UPI00202A6C9E|nr:hypothetical protein [Pinirhizobacter soli]
MSLTPVNSLSVPVPVITPLMAPSNATAAGQNTPPPTNVGNVAEHHRQREDQAPSHVKPEVSAAAAATKGEPEV